MDGGRGAPAAAVGAVLTLVALVLVAATWGASVGPEQMFRGTGTDVGTESSAPPEAAEPSASRDVDEGEDGRDEGRQPPEWLQVVGFLVQLTAGLLFLYVLARLLGVAAGRWAARRRARARIERIDFDVLDSREVVASAIARDAPEQVAVLQAGSPRNGIVECWHRFEVQARSAGVGRKAWETSSEFTLRLLDLVDADAEAVSTLAGLYREARFSDHETDEAERSRALDALERIHHGLGALA